MKKLLFASILLLVFTSIFSCKQNTENTSQNDTISSEVIDTDTTIYGVSGNGTSMHSLELITDNGDTVRFIIDEDALYASYGDSIDTNIFPNIVKGGLISDNHYAVIASKNEDGEMVATNVINMSSLFGKWKSLERNFEIIEDGTVMSTHQVESNPYTAWRIHNGKLILSNDTFDVLTIGPDTLEIENNHGIFIFSRP